MIDGEDMIIFFFLLIFFLEIGWGIPKTPWFIYEKVCYISKTNKMVCKNKREQARYCSPLDCSQHLYYHDNNICSPACPFISNNTNHHIMLLTGRSYIGAAYLFLDLVYFKKSRPALPGRARFNNPPTNLFGGQNFSDILIWS